MEAIEVIITVLLITTIAVLLPVSLIIDMLLKHKKEHYALLKELDLLKTNYQDELLRSQVEIQEQTFRHIALELHDNVSHFLSLAKLHLHSLDKEEPNIPEKVEATALLLGCSLEEIRKLSHTLNTDSILSIGLVKAVEREIEALEKTRRFKVHFEVVGICCYLSDQKEVFLFRIIQEALNNIIRHSKASCISIDLIYTQSDLQLTIVDDGIGFNTNRLDTEPASSSSGIRNIFKRGTLINASINIESNHNAGTKISIITPY